VKALLATVLGGHPESRAVCAQGHFPASDVCYRSVIDVENVRQLGGWSDLSVVMRYVTSSDASKRRDRSARLVKRFRRGVASSRNPKLEVISGARRARCKRRPPAQREK
jgi:hypothetical protein